MSVIESGLQTGRAVKSHTPRVTARVATLENIIPEIDTPVFARTRALLGEIVGEFEAHFSESEAKQAYRALELALRLHLPQGVRLDGQPFVNHIMEVPLHLMRTLGIRKLDCVIASVLHDVVEDQSRALVAGEYGEVVAARIPEQELRAAALGVLEHQFGNGVRILVDKLTNQNYTELAAAEKSRLLSMSGGKRTGMSLEKIKHRLYQKHVVELGEGQDTDTQNAFAIKIADFLDNALRHNSLPVYCPDEIATKERLADKRGLLFVYFAQILFPRLSETHPLFPVRGALIKRFDSYYYSAYVPLPNLG